MYKTGTIAVTNGSAIITGSGTLWVDAGVLNPGDLIFCPDGTLQEVLSFQSNTQLTLAGDGHGNTVYLGATVAAQPYGIVPIGMLPSTLALRVKEVLTEAQAAIASAVRTTAAQGLTTTQQNNARANILALGAADVGKGLLVKSVAGGVAVVLTAAEAANQFIELTGALTANINLVVPAAARLFVIRNSTTGAYTVTTKTAAGTGVTALQGGRMLIECDGTNCVDALSYMRQTGGSVDGTPIGSTTPAAGSFTTLSSTDKINAVDGKPIGWGSPSTTYMNGSSAAGWMEFVVGGVQRALATTTGLAVTGALSSSGALTTAGIKEDAAGNLTVGTPSSLGARITAVETINNAFFGKNTSATAGTYIAWNSATAGNNIFHSFATEASYTLRGSIDYNRTGGLVRYNTTSDKTLKTRLGPAPQATSLQILDNTVLEEYFWNNDETKKPQIGPFAQDLYTTFKGAVSVGGFYDEVIPAITERRLVTEAVAEVKDEEGNTIAESVEAVYETVIAEPEHTVKKYQPWGVDKTAFSFHLIAGYQAQKQEISNLKAELASVLERLTALEAK